MMTNEADGGMAVPSTSSSARQVTALNRLIVACKDDGRTYREAAYTASDPTRRSQMLVLSRRRSQFADELASLVGALGGSPAPYGSSRETARRFARSVKIAVAGPHDGDIFRECVRVGERVASRYAIALRSHWPEGVRSVLAAHSREVALDCERMRALRGMH